MKKLVICIVLALATAAFAAPKSDSALVKEVKRAIFALRTDLEHPETSGSGIAQHKAAIDRKIKIFGNQALTPVDYQFMADIQTVFDLEKMLYIPGSKISNADIETALQILINFGYIKPKVEKTSPEKTKTVQPKPKYNSRVIKHNPQRLQGPVPWGR